MEKHPGGKHSLYLMGS